MRMKITTITHKPPTTKKPALNFLKSKQSHPHTTEREYMKALNSVKLNKLFAKPFIKQFSLNEGITSLQINPLDSNELLALTYSNEVSLVNIKENKIRTLKVDEHIKAVGYYLPDTPKPQIFIATVNDISFLDTSAFLEAFNDSRKYLLRKRDNSKTLIKESTFSFKIRDASFSVFTNQLFLATNEGLIIYRNGSFTNIFDTEIDKVKISKELICVASNNTLHVLDAVSNTPLNSYLLTTINDISISQNSVAVACEDSNIYVIRTADPLAKPQQFLGHTHPATACHLSISRNLLVSGAFDKSIRLFDLKTRRSEILYCQRMSEINCIEYSKGQELVFSGSNDGSLRVWKAPNQHGLVNRKKARDLNYRKALVAKFGGVKEVEIIGRSRRLPKELKGGLKNKYEARKAEERRRRA